MSTSTTRCGIGRAGSRRVPSRSRAAAHAQAVLLNRFTDDRAIVLPLSSPGWLRRLNAAGLGVLLAVAVGWLWLRAATRPAARALLAKGRAAGSLRSYLWTVSLRVAAAVPWLLAGILATGLLLGLMLGGQIWWWLGPPAALLGASLAPAWADPVILGARK